MYEHHARFLCNIVNLFHSCCKCSSFCFLQVSSLLRIMDTWDRHFCSAPIFYIWSTCRFCSVYPIDWSRDEDGVFTTAFRLSSIDGRTSCLPIISYLRSLNKTQWSRAGKVAINETVGDEWKLCFLTEVLTEYFLNCSIYTYGLQINLIKIRCFINNPVLKRCCL